MFVYLAVALLFILFCYCLVILWGSQEFRSRLFIAIVLCGIIVWTIFGILFFLLFTIPASLFHRARRIFS